MNKEREVSMNEILVEATDSPLRFPDPRADAYARAQEFRRLSPEQRWQEITALMEFGLDLARSSPRRAAIEQEWQAQEAEWQRLQQQLFEHHAQ
jgi:hypothetical protein